MGVVHNLSEARMKPCPSFPGYSATAEGKVFSHRRKGKGKQRGSVVCVDHSFSYELAQFATKKGYRTVCVTLQTNKARPVGVHQLVADAFHGPKPDGLQVRHLNGSPSDNRAANLQYGTPKQNAADRKQHGTYSTGSKHVNSKLLEKQVNEIRTLRKVGMKVKELANNFSVSASTIESIIYNKSYVEFKRVQS